MVFAASPTSDVVHVGSTDVYLVQTTGADGPSYFHPHENEHTSADVARDFVKTKGGTLLEIKCAGRRRIAFSLDGKHFDFDPNRMFTDVGLELTLTTHNQAAMEPVKLLRDSIIAKLKLSGGPIIAVHNNEDMSINMYRRGGRFAKEARAVSARSTGKPHEFFLVLDEKLFHALERSGFNAVLQSMTPTDDGSLSVYCQKAGLRYVNIEAGVSHAAEQRRMLQALLPLLGR